MQDMELRPEDIYPLCSRDLSDSPEGEKRRIELCYNKLTKQIDVSIYYGTENGLEIEWLDWDRYSYDNLMVGIELYIEGKITPN